MRSETSSRVSRTSWVIKIVSNNAGAVDAGNHSEHGHYRSSGRPACLEEMHVPIECEFPCIARIRKIDGEA